MNIIEYCDKNGILWQPINIKRENNKKTPTFVNGYMPKANDIAKLSEEDIIKRQINVKDTEYIAIYTVKVQQIDIDSDIGMFNIKGPYFKSVTKKLPHYFIKLDSENFPKVKKAIKGGDLLAHSNGGTWSYAKKDVVVLNANMEIPKIKYSEILALEKNYKKIEKITCSIKQKIVNYQVWFNVCNALYNYSNSLGLDALKIVHNFSSEQAPDKYDDTAIETINNIPKKLYPYNIEYLDSIIKDSDKESDGSVSEMDDPSEDPDEKNSGMIEDKETSYAQFKTEFEKKAFLCVSMKKIIYHGFSDDFMIMSDPSTVSVHYTVGITKEYGHILKYGTVIKGDKGKKQFSEHIATWINRDAEKLAYYNYDFLPNPYPIKPTTFNIWKGFNKKVYSYTEEEADDVIGIYKRFLEHVGVSHPALPEYMHQYYSNIVQNPGMKEGVLFVLTGVEGTFKGTLFRLISGIIGHQYTHEVTDAEKVIGRFNGGLMNKLFCSLNEAVSYEMIQKSGTIKGLVTDLEFSYEQKGMPVVKGHNFTRFMICTNENIGAKATADDRRNIYIECTYMDTKLRMDINEVINSEKSCYILYEYLSKTEIKYKNVNEWGVNRPLTEKHTEIVNHFTDIFYSFIQFEIKKSNKMPFMISRKNFDEAYNDFMASHPKITKKTYKEIGIFMTKFIRDSKLCSRKQDRKNNTGYVFYDGILEYMLKAKLVPKEDHYEKMDCLFD